MHPRLIASPLKPFPVRACGAFSHTIGFCLYLCVDPPLSFCLSHPCLLSLAVDGLDEDNCVLVLLRDIDSERDGYPGIEPLQESVRITVRIAGLLFQPTSRKTTRVLNIANVDFHLPIQPAPVVNWASR